MCFCVFLTPSSLDYEEAPQGTLYAAENYSYLALAFLLFGGYAALAVRRKVVLHLNKIILLHFLLLTTSAASVLGTLLYGRAERSLHLYGGLAATLLRCYATPEAEKEETWVKKDRVKEPEERNLAVRKSPSVR